MSDPGPWTWAAEAYVYGRAGERAKAESAIRQMQDEIHGPRFDLQPLEAFAFSGLKDKERVLAALEAGYREHSSMLNELKVAPQYDLPAR